MPIGPTGWPWLEGWEPDLLSAIPNLVKAGALIAAELDRLLALEGSVVACDVATESEGSADE
jgi:hypothetical protein